MWQSGGMALMRSPYSLAPMPVCGPGFMALAAAVVAEVVEAAGALV
jgi:hypothetical protein